MHSNDELQVDCTYKLSFYFLKATWYIKCCALRYGGRHISQGGRENESEWSEYICEKREPLIPHSFSHSPPTLSLISQGEPRRSPRPTRDSLSPSAAWLRRKEHHRTRWEWARDFFVKNVPFTVSYHARASRLHRSVKVKP